MLQRLFQTETRAAAAAKRRGKWWASYRCGNRRHLGCFSSRLDRVPLQQHAGRFVGRERFRVRTNATLPSFAALFCKSGFGLFQLILSHRTLLNQPKSAGFSTSRTSPASVDKRKIFFLEPFLRGTN
jgi:hypothetical protein